MRPPTGNALQRCRVVTHGTMNNTIAGDALVETGNDECQEATLARACDTEVSTVPVGELLNIVHSTYATKHDTLVVAHVAVVSTIVPVVVQGAVLQVVIDALLHGDGNAVYAYLKGDDALRCRPHIATIGTYAGTRHTQQCRIAAWLHWNAQYAISTAIPTHVLERHLIDVHILGTTLGQQALRRFKRCPTCLFYSFLPIADKVVGQHGCRL